MTRMQGIQVFRLGRAQLVGTVRLNRLARNRQLRPLPAGADAVKNLRQSAGIAPPTGASHPNGRPLHPFNLRNLRMSESQVPMQ